ncbi:MAG TPA: hypothetical protein VF116_01665 [Ktedonobacterales bacterium]
MMEPPASDAQRVACHVKGCDAPADHTCDRCGQPFCADHVQPHTIERRDEPDERAGLLLTRAPTHRETYMLCRLCGSKPIIGKRPPLSSPL